MQTPLSLPAWLHRLETLHPSAIALGLDRVQAIYERLALIRPACPIVTVTGTNGKGSTVRLLEAIFLAAGYRVGCYTSPHLYHYNERIRIQGRSLSDEAIIQSFEKIDARRGDIPLTYFEFGTLAAFQALWNSSLDIIILEVGLGGRLDAVNVVGADVAVVTSIALDHMEWLGPTRESIALEKAGIFRPYAPAVIAEPNPPAALLTFAENQSTPLYSVGTAYTYEVLMPESQWACYTTTQTYSELPWTPLGIDNAAAALMVCDCLQSRLPVSVAAVHSALQKARLAGRMQLLQTYPNVHVDGAHNPAAAKRIADRLKQMNCEGKTHIVVGMLSDKDQEHTLAEWLPLADYLYLGGLSGARGAPVERLAEAVRFLNPSQVFQLFPTIQEAFLRAREQAKPTDRILVSGSFSSVAAIGMVYNQASQAVDKVGE